MLAPDWPSPSILASDWSAQVSALFWILVIHDPARDPASALTLADRLYEESIMVPYLARYNPGIEDRTALTVLY